MRIRYRPEFIRYHAGYPHERRIVIGPYFSIWVRAITHVYGVYWVKR